MLARVRAYLAPALGAAGTLAASYGASLLAPDRVRQWGDVLGVSPVVVVMGVMLWSFAWRGHNHVIAELRALRAVLDALTVAMLKHDQGSRPAEPERPT